MPTFADVDAVHLGELVVDRLYEGLTQVWPVVGPFVPTDVAGLIIWLDARQITGLADGAAMSSWANSAGSGLPAAAAVVGAPVYRTDGINGHPAVRFGEGNASSMSIGHSLTIGERTVFQVIKTAGSPYGSYHTTQLQELDPYMQTYGPGSGTIHTFSNPDLDSGVGWSGSCQYITLWCKSSPSQQWLEVDGIQTTAGWVPGSSSSPFYIGGFQPGGYYSNAYMGEVLIYDRCLSDVERTQVRDYLTAKWATAAWTPDDLPGLICWLDASTLAVSDGGAVTGWADRTGSGHTAVPARANAPTYHLTGGPGSGPSVRFSKAAMTPMHIQGLGTAISNAPEYTLILLMRVTDQSTTNVILAAPAEQLWTFLFEGNSATIEWGHGGGSSFRQYFGAWPTGSAQLYSAVFNAVSGSIDLWNNGALVVSYSGGWSGAIPNVGPDVMLGGYFQDIVPLGAYVTDVLWYDRQLVDSERTQVETYLRARQGLS